MKSRWLLVIVFLFASIIGTGATSAGSGVRFSTSYSFDDDFEDINTTYAHIPSTNVVSSVQTNYSTEVGERVHDCRFVEPQAGSHTVWFKFNFPGGTATLDTGLSDYDTVMSIYRPAGTFATLETVACNDDQVPGSNNKAKIIAALEPGTYFVQISRYATSATGTALSLTVVIMATYSGIAPDNDNFANATAVVLGETYPVNNVQFATEEILEPDPVPSLECSPGTPSKSVWFKFDPGLSSARLNITLEGSLLDSGIYINSDTRVDVFEGTSLITLDSIACDDDTHNDAAALANVSVSYNTPVYIRVTESTQHGLLGPSSYRLKVTAGYFGIRTVNADFEDPFSGEWKEKNISGADGRLCVFPPTYFGDCAYQFVGGTDENSKLSRTFTLPANLQPSKSGQIFAVFAIHATSPETNFKVTLKIKYTDGKPPTKQVLNIVGSPGPDYIFYQISAQLVSKKVGVMSLLFNNKSTAGTVYLDSTGAAYRGGFARSAPGEVLPLPLPLPPA